MRKTHVPETATVTDDDDECDDNVKELDAVASDSSAVKVVDDDSVSSDSDWGRSVLTVVVTSSASRAGVTGSGSSAMGGRRCFPGRAETEHIQSQTSETGDMKQE